MKDKYLLDSSIWIELERGNPVVEKLVQPLIDRNAVCLADVIAAELLRGTRGLKDYRRLEQVLDDFVTLTTEWRKVARLAFRVARTGHHPPLVDLYIARCVIENHRILITQDHHFQAIAKVQPFDLQLVPKTH